MLKSLLLVGSVLVLAACNNNYKIGEDGPNMLNASTSFDGGEVGIGSSSPSDESPSVHPEDGDHTPEVGSHEPEHESHKPDVDKPSHGPEVSSDEPSSEEPSAGSQEIVECDDGHPKNKIALNADSSAFVIQHSNDSSNRVCMSKNACLTILSGEVFPGKGTCGHAKILNDAEVASLAIATGASK